MMNRKTFSKITKRIMRSQKGIRDPKLVHPRREWVIGILAASFVLIGAAAWSATTYLNYQDIELTMGQGTEAEVVVYRESLVNASLEVFTERQRELDRLMNGLGPASIETGEAVSDEDIPAATSSETVVQPSVPEDVDSSGTSSPTEISDEDATGSTDQEPDVTPPAPEEGTADQPSEEAVVNPNPTFEL